MRHYNLPNIREIKKLVYKINALMREYVHSKSIKNDFNLKKNRNYKNIIKILKKELYKVSDKKTTEEVIENFKKNIVALLDILSQDAEAGVNGDPASSGVDEIITAYPYMFALTVHRVANFLYKNKVVTIPRIMSEIAHRITGIDINPGATIGKGFFIDHGTGVVIGETTVIKDNVKLYQGVTLGAFSFPKDACGAFIKTVKRHPTIENNVVIYANATILGDITIGENSIIGSNVWINRNIPKCTMLYFNSTDTYIERKINCE